jgi:hypothetical protein
MAQVVPMEILDSGNSQRGFKRGAQVNRIVDQFAGFIPPGATWEQQGSV